MIAVVEIPKKEEESLPDKESLVDADSEIVSPKKLIGPEDVVQWIVQLTAASIPVFVNYLLQRKKKKKSTKVTIEGINIQYSSKKELEDILTIIAKQKAQKGDQS